MKWILISVIVFIIFPGRCNKSEHNNQQEVQDAALVLETVDFENQVKPILLKNCSPCHFTGGKMYDKLPFDQDTTILNHSPGILKRIKGDENTVIKNFIAQQKTGPG